MSRYVTWTLLQIRRTNKEKKNYIYLKKILLFNILYIFSFSVGGMRSAFSKVDIPMDMVFKKRENTVNKLVVYYSVCSSNPIELK